MKIVFLNALLAHINIKKKDSNGLSKNTATEISSAQYSWEDFYLKGQR